MTMKDFSKDRTDIPEFKIGDNTYRGLAGLPAGILLGIATMFGEAMTEGDIGKQIDVFKGLVRDLLEDSSADLFLESMESKDLRNMIDLDQLQDALLYLMEVHGVRPTTPSTPLSPGLPSPESGIDWTGSTSGEVSTSAVSPLTVF